MGENLFEGLPPLSSSSNSNRQEQVKALDFELQQQSAKTISQAPIPILKSSMKRPKLATESQPSVVVNPESAEPEKKRLRFKTTTDASEAQVIEAMQKIASHISNPTKFAKASKLSIQLIQAGSVKPVTSDNFFAILEAAMSSPTSCRGQAVRADYHTFFSAAQDVAEVLNKKQKNHLSVWILEAVVANDLFTDDSFVFSKTATRIKEEISNLPIATEDDDIDEAATLKDEIETARVGDQKQENGSQHAVADGNDKDESDPFGLDAFITTSKKDEKPKGKKETAAKQRKEEEEDTRRVLKSRREALITCLEIAARRYKMPWCQTVIDILGKHAFDNGARFTSVQRKAIGKLWASIKEQQVRRKQGKSVNGKLDVTDFESLQQKYSSETISIRRAVGGGGDRRCQQWLG